MTSLLRVDDSDPRIVYSATAWYADIDTSGQSPAYNGTQHLARHVGSTAKFTFNGQSPTPSQHLSLLNPISMLGTGVIVLGSYGSGLTVSSYTLDSALPVSYTAPNTSTEIYGVPFFQPAPFPDGQHQLTITLTGGDWFWLDEIRYNPSPSPSLPKKTPTGAVVGGAVGAVGVVALMAIALWLFTRNRRRRRSEDFESEPVTSSLFSHISSLWRSEMSIDGDQRPVDSDSSVVIPFITDTEITPSGRSNMKRQPHVDRETSIGRSSPPPTQQIQHLDGGICIARGSGNEEDMIELPPVYDLRL